MFMYEGSFVHKIKKEVSPKQKKKINSLFQ